MSIDQILSELKTQNDRSAAITGGSLTEAAITAAIIKRWHIPSKTFAKKLFTGTGPVATFSAKIDIGFAIQLYGPQTKATLHNVRRVRNLFAHNFMPMAFTNDKVSAMCARLDLAFADKFDPLENHSDERNKYIRTCMALITLLSDGRADHMP